MPSKKVDANEALAKAKGTYGRFAEAAKRIDPVTSERRTAWHS
jgi:hypothetical protein